MGLIAVCTFSIAELSSFSSVDENVGMVFSTSTVFGSAGEALPITSCNGSLFLCRFAADDISLSMEILCHYVCNRREHPWQPLLPCTVLLHFGTLLSLHVQTLVSDEMLVDS